MHRPVICDVVAVIAQWRREEWHEPDRVDPKLLKIIELLFKPLKISNPIPVAVLKCADVHLIDDRVFVPEGILSDWQTAFSWIISSSRRRSAKSKSIRTETVQPELRLDKFCDSAVFSFESWFFRVCSLLGNHLKAHRPYPRSLRIR